MKKISLSSLLTTTIVVLLLSQPVSGVESGKKCQNYDFNFHGYFKTDMSYDNAQIYPGDFHFYVPAYSEADNALYFSTKESRIGFDFLWKEESLKTQATLEFDFFGAGAASENKATPMLRHAYFKITGGKWSIIAGQTWDVISPLVPKTVNYSVAWGEGNIGYRRPQIRFSTWADVGEQAKFKLDLAVTRNMGGDFSVNEYNSIIAGDGVDNGADAAMPAVQGRLGITSKFADEGNLSLGVSGHYGQEKYNKTDTTTSGSPFVSEMSMDSWSINTDMALKINKKICLKGEFFMGQALKTYLGGALQNTDGIYEPLPSMGGWGMLSLQPTAKLLINTGYSFDDPDDTEYDIPKGGSGTFRDMNSLIFGNIMYGITDNVTGMFELAYLKTEYMTKHYVGQLIESSCEEYDSFRIQFALVAAIK